MNEYIAKAIAQIEAAAVMLADANDVEGAAFLRGSIDGYYRSGYDQGYKADQGPVKTCYTNGYKAGLYSAKWERLPVTMAEAENA